MKLSYSFLVLGLLSGCKPTSKSTPVVPSGSGDEAGASADDVADPESATDASGADAPGPATPAPARMPAPATAVTPAMAPVAAPADQSILFFTLDKARWEMACEKDPGTNYDCPTTKKVDKTLIVNGDPSIVYTIELRIRGIVEPMVYSGGTREGKNLMIGGMPNNPTFSYFKMSVSSPSMDYYLNAFDAVGGFVSAIDYTTKIKVNGGATIKLSADSQNGTQIANKGLITIPDIVTPPELKYGQFIQINLISATK
ncbi:MAG: hypothetical protein H7249_04205 [Chitinophagaceae bacterium]|nr:hypothetical protein [Oligoflexus sp.]